MGSASTEYMVTGCIVKEPEHEPGEEARKPHSSMTYASVPALRF